MLVIDISQVPPEGVDVDEPLDGGKLHLDAERDFVLGPGGVVRCHVDKVDGNSVHVRGRMEAPLGLECGRCLEPYPLVLNQELDLFYLPHHPGDAEEEEDEVELDDHEMVVAYYEGNHLDLGEVVREQCVLSLPLKPLCREDCRGRCPSCGKNRNLEHCECSAPEEAGDPRLAALKKLFDDETR